MININLQDFIYYSIKKDYISNLKWMLAMFTYLTKKEYEDEFIKITNKEFYVKIDDEYLIITKDYKDNILDFKNVIEIDNSILGNIKNSIKTTVGRVILNYLINTKCFNNKIYFINEGFTLKTIEKIIEERGLTDDVSDDKLTIDEYLSFRY